jgi:hypothetical protein
VAAPLIEPVLDPARYLADVTDAAKAAGFSVHRFAEIAGHPMIALTWRTRGPRPRIYVSAGIHGDEPAGPLTVLHLLRTGVFDERAVWFVCPLLNPLGFTRRTRENADGIDLNRDYRSLRSAEIQAHARWLGRQPNFDLTLCVHEDWEAQGYYLYELNPSGRRSLAPEMIAAVSSVCPLETARIIDGREVDEPAIIRPSADPLTRELWPESIYLHAHHTRLGYTLESPSTAPIERRVAAHTEAVVTAIGRMAEVSRSPAPPAR